MSVRIYEQLEGLMCDERAKHKEPCHCATLQKHYGPKIFKCTFPSCGLNRQGFDTRHARKTHIEHHARPWKCSVRSCPYAVIGFAKMGARRDHWIKRHRISAPPDPVNLAPHQLSRDDLQVLMFELTKAGDIDGLLRLLSQFTLPSWERRPALLLAAKMGSLPMVEVLSHGDEYWFDSPWKSDAYIRAVMKSENKDLFRWLLDQLASLERVNDYNILAAEAIATTSPEIYVEWEDFLFDPTRLLEGGNPNYSDGEANPIKTDEFRQAMKLIPQHNKRSVLFSQIAFNATGKNTMFEARLIQTWHRLIAVLGGAPLNPRFLGWSLICLARSSSLSITVATELLRLGAPLDFPRGKDGTIPTTDLNRHQPEPATRPRSQTPDQTDERRRRQTRHRGMTALHFASRGTSEKAARFVRFLLEEGADPDYGYAGRKPAQERAAALMEKWLGESWEDLVERTREARAKRKRRDGVEDLEGEKGEDDEGEDDEGPGEEEEEEEEEEKEEAPIAKRRRTTAKR